MRYLSVCSGIEAATVAWHPLGWRPAVFSEIEPFPRAVLKHHWPDVPLHGRDRRKGEAFEDHAAEAGFQTIGADDYGPIDLLVGGTPCQSFSVAGLRGGMADGRGNLALEYLRLAYRKRARWVVWENVPGVFSSNAGEDFRCFLSGLVRWDVPIPAEGWRNAGVIAAGPADGAFGLAWRVLDAQFAGVPQRRRRVFVVGHIGDWRRAAAVLFERHSLSGNPAPRRKTGEGITASPGGIAGTCSSKWAKGTGGPAGDEHYNLIAHSLRAEGFDASEDGTGRGTPLVPVTCGSLTAKGIDEGMGQAAASGLLIPVAIQERAVSENPDAGPQGKGWQEGTAYTLEARNKVQAVAFNEVAGTLKSCGGKSGTPNGAEEATRLVDGGSAVRRLTPRECERLQGFPDDHTRISWPGWRDLGEDETPEQCREDGLEVKLTKSAKWRVKDVDGPRYKALGNSMAVPVMRWIGERIQAVEDLRLNDLRPPESAAA